MGGRGEERGLDWGRAEEEGNGKGKEERRGEGTGEGRKEGEGVEQSLNNNNNKTHSSNVACVAARFGEEKGREERGLGRSERRGGQPKTIEVFDLQVLDQ